MAAYTAELNAASIPLFSNFFRVAGFVALAAIVPGPAASAPAELASWPRPCRWTHLYRLARPGDAPSLCSGFPAPAPGSGFC